MRPYKVGLKRMSFESDAARRYRAHAKELRAIAAADDFTETREKLLQVASGFDRMARRFEVAAASESGGTQAPLAAHQPHR
jgi:hypothetical protein